MKARTKQIRLRATVVHHGNGAYRPGESGGDSENTPDTKPVAWAAAGRRGRTCGMSDSQYKNSIRRSKFGRKNVYAGKRSR